MFCVCITKKSKFISYYEMTKKVKVFLCFFRCVPGRYSFFLVVLHGLELSVGNF